MGPISYTHLDVYKRQDEKTPDKADTDKENPDPDIFTSGDDFGAVSYTHLISDYYL